jgi:hypothetical protein
VSRLWLVRQAGSGLTETERVQLGVSLSAAEKLQAIAGPWSSWIGELVKKYVMEEDTLAKKLRDWDTTRAKPFQALIALIQLTYEPSRQIQPTYSNMATFLDRKEPVSGWRLTMIPRATG